ncbi:bifunctional 2-polyprenyl-6-hydroxyphenol methylase/3-demethylubiquinol 3-O-methyltransferase UbiG [Polaromonas sp. YR568]|uniref:class I SAM-dependent methyltransferase n=1 Tax=Polaromonas sp. YR568 TaxID=1855301 RepID=UPI000B80F511|nr:class I SAM-dependent methyltransferase [Polaromonas sp. YR568]
MDKNFYRIFFEVQKRHWWFVGKKNVVLDLISRLVPKTEHPTILDIGCGSGLMLGALEQIGETSGMDMSDDAINFSREIFSGLVKKGMLPDAVPYPDKYFSLVTALDVIEHVEDDRAALSAIYAKMAPNGRGVITVPAFMFLWSEHDVLNEHKRRYRLDDLRTKLLDAGFTIEKLSYFNTFLFPLISLVRIANNLLRRKGGSDVELPPSFINYTLKKIFGAEKYFLRFLNFPFGVSLLAVVRK